MTLSQVEEVASQLSFEEQLTLFENLAQKLRMRAPGRVPQDLYGAWKGQFPEVLDVDTVLKEARTEWQKEWSDSGEFTD
jgi:hypothetical protein